MDIYDTLGPIELALAITTLFEKAEGKKIDGQEPVFKDRVIAIFKKHFDDSEVERITTTASEVKKTRSRRGWKIAGAALAVTAAGAGYSFLNSTSKDAQKTPFNTAREEYATLLLRRAQSPDHQTLTEEDMKRLIWLENIEIPDLKNKINAGSFGDKAIGLLPVGAVMLAGLYAFHMVIKHVEKAQSGGKDSPKDVDSPKEAKQLLADIADVITDACISASPRITLPDTTGITSPAR